MASSFYSPELLRSIAEQNTWLTLLPEIGLAVLALLVLLLEVSGTQRQRLIPGVAIVGQGIVLLGVVALIIWQPFADGEAFAGMLQHSLTGNLMRLFFLISSIGISLLALAYLRQRGLSLCVFYHLLLVIMVGLMLLAQSAHFVMLFVALELVTVGFYVLVGYCRGSGLSLEAGLKYLILGGCSSAILLAGVVLLYGVASNPNLPEAIGNPLAFSALQGFISAHSNHPLVLIGAALTIAGIAFKIGVVPFQIWIPDVYQGAPTPVTALLAVSSKAGGIFVLLNLVLGVFAPLSAMVVPLLSAMAVGGILFGNLAAMSQRNVKRLMGLSGIAHAGYLLVGVIAAMSLPWAVWAVFFYLLTYLLASFAVFGVMLILAPEEDAWQELFDYRNLGKDYPFLGGVLAIGLGSLAGIPPLGGFIGKVLIFYAAFQAGLYSLLAVSLIGVVLSVVYYFDWLLMAFSSNHPFPSSQGQGPSLDLKVHPLQRAVMVCLAGATILLGLYPGVFYLLG